MKNFSLYVASGIFLLMAIFHLVRYFLGVVIVVGNHHIALEVSPYAGGVSLILALWMFIAAKVKPHKQLPPTI
jgi:hypothetical protein